jgi:hypothetical protein
VSITVRDTMGDDAEAGIKINILSDADLKPPTIVITEPSDDSFFAPDDPITFKATVADEDDAEEDLIVTATSSLDGAIEVSSTPTTDGTWEANIAGLSGGEHLITLTVFDTYEATGSDSRTITINGSPSTPVVAITPNPSPSGELLMVEIIEEATDPEGDPIDYDYQWFLNDEPYAAGETPVIPAYVTMRDEYWEVSVTARDPFTSGDPTSDSITIENSPPRIDGVTILPSSPRTGDDLLASVSGWFDQDEDLPLYDFEWEHNGEVDTDEITDSFPKEKTERGDDLRVTATPRDAFADGEPVSSSLMVVENTPPTGGGVVITPPSPEPTDDLLCNIDVTPDDDDGDSITYSYMWLADGIEVPGLTTAFVESIETSNLETWTCQVTPDDGIDSGSMFSDSVAIADGTSPPPPIIDGPAAHRNKEAMDLTGTCEPLCDLDFYCSDTTGTSWASTEFCTSAGEFSISIDPLVRGEVTECYATCTDGAGNVSDDSAAVSTEVCDPEDIYENSTYGDSLLDPIDEWGSISDDGTTSISIIGNVLEDDDEDWYIISATDGAPTTTGIDYFRFDAQVADGDSQYSFVVYRADPSGTESDSCMPDADGYTEYSWYNEDSTDLGEEPAHGTGMDPRYCQSGSAYNECEDDSADFYIHVFRNSSVEASCQNYQLEITNGVW